MKPIVVIGNGRSLNEHLARGDFDLLSRHAITIAMNHIDDLYDQTDWRPTHWVFAEHEFLPQDEFVTLNWIMQSFIKPGISNCHIGVGGHYPGAFRYHFPDEDLRHVHWYERCEYEHRGQYGDKDVPKAWHWPLWCRYGGTMNSALQLAGHMTSPTIGVIGCDLGYIGPDNNDFHGRIAVIDGDWSRHDDTLRDMHGIAKREIESRGKTIYNVGIGGLLDVYPRMNLREFLNLW